jgi:hypothetical protein
MIILAIAQVLDLKGVKAKQSSDGTPMDFQFTQGVDPALARRRTFNIFGWILGFFLAIWLIGFAITVPLLVFTYLKIQSAENWRISIILSAVAWLIFYGLFVRTLHLPFPEGLIFTWLGF